MGLGKPESPVLSTVWDELLGPLGCRQQLCDSLPTPSDSQKFVLQNIAGAVTVVNNFAGGGKSTLLRTVMLHIMRSSSGPESPLLFFVAPTQSVVKDFLESIQASIGTSTGVAGLGYDAGRRSLPGSPGKPSQQDAATTRDLLRPSGSLASLDSAGGSAAAAAAVFRRLSEPVRWPAASLRPGSATSTASTLQCTRCSRVLWLSCGLLA